MRSERYLGSPGLPSTFRSSFSSTWIGRGRGSGLGLGLGLGARLVLG
jgi:hypothetical protein